VVLLPWSQTLEDYLDVIGRSVDDFARHMTGGWMFGYVDALHRAGVSTALACWSRSVTAPQQRVHEPTGAPLWLLPEPLSHRLLRRAPVARAYRSTSLRALHHVVRAHDAGAILSQEYESARFDVAVAYGRVARVPVFATFQGANRTRTRAEAIVRGRSIRSAAGLVIAAGAERDRVVARYGIAPDRIAAIFNPIDVDEWSPGDRSRARAALGITGDALVVAWHGRVEYASKGIDVLVDAWRQVVASHGERAHLVLVGSGRDAARLHDALGGPDAGQVHWVDEFLLDRARLRAHLAAADVWVFPSRHEGFPGAPVEAMACGLPVVAADANGVRDILRDGEQSGGIVVARDDAAALAREVDALLRDLPRARAVGANARRRVVDAFSLDAVGTRLRAFFTARGMRPVRR
jgi:glycosyltransferase involved in cell wall biosynthesis